jgi:hypothetical protein
MSSTRSPKLCIHCGCDVAHQRRHKDRYGQYECRACYRNQRSGWRRRWQRFWAHAGRWARENMWLRRGTVCLVAAPIGVWVFYRVMVWLIVHAAPLQD